MRKIAQNVKKNLVYISKTSGSNPEQSRPSRFLVNLTINPTNLNRPAKSEKKVIKFSRWLKNGFFIIVKLFFSLYVFARSVFQKIKNLIFFGLIDFFSGKKKFIPAKLHILSLVFGQKKSSQSPDFSQDSLPKPREEENGQERDACPNALAVQPMLAAGQIDELESAVAAKDEAVCPPLPLADSGQGKDFVELDQNFRRKCFFGALNLAVVLLAVILPFKFISLSLQNDWLNLPGQIKGVSETAADSFNAALANLRDFDFLAAQDNFQKAGGALESARAQISQINENLQSIMKFMPAEKLRLAGEVESILNVGELGAAIGEHLSWVAAAWQGTAPAAWAEKIYASHSHLIAASRLADGLADQLGRIGEKNIPEQYRSQFLSTRETAIRAADSLRELSFFGNLMVKILGFERKTRYLLVFQNNSEMRGSGGFVGSYALVDFDRGEIKNLEVPPGGSYDTAGGLLKNIIAPEPLWLVNPRWHFWDANWWPDWPTSARKLAWFLEKSDGPTVDGVIALTPTVVEDILRLLGPIRLGEPYDTTIDADNFWSIVQTTVENKNGGENTPKKIIGDFLPLLLDRLSAEKDKARLSKAAGILWQAMDEKNILYYFTDNELQEFFLRWGWAGEMKNTKWDYLLVAHANIAGGKSDRAIRETIKHEALIQADGAIVDTLTIIREHTASKQDQFIGVRNNDWLRVYVPMGSVLLEASGFSRPDSQYFSYPAAGAEADPDILRGEGQSFAHYPSGTKVYNELGKTVFANWTQVDPGETLIVTFKYRLPFRFSPLAFSNSTELDASQSAELAPYVLLAEKQPGAKTAKFYSRLVCAPAANLVWRYPQGLNTSPRGWDVSLDLSRQAYLAALFQPAAAISPITN